MIYLDSKKISNKNLGRIGDFMVRVSLDVINKTLNRPTENDRNRKSYLNAFTKFIRNQMRREHYLRAYLYICTQPEHFRKIYLKARTKKERNLILSKWLDSCKAIYDIQIVYVLSDPGSTVQQEALKKLQDTLDNLRKLIDEYNLDIKIGKKSRVFHQSNAEGILRSISELLARPED